MRRFIVIFFALILATSLSYAQKGLTGRFTCNFTLYDKNDESKPVTSGVAYVQDNCYRVETADGYVVGNGRDRWIYNSKDGELVIQKDSDSIFKKIAMTRTSNSTARVVYANFMALLKNVRDIDALPLNFFSVDKALLDDNVIITDLRD